MPVVPGVDHRWIDVDGVSLHVAESGVAHRSSERPSLVLLHGWPQHWFCWRKVMPALAETPALKDVDIGVWFVLMGPAGLPEPIATKLRTALAETLKAPDYRRSMEASGSVVPVTQPDIGRFLVDETEKYRRIVQFAKIQDE